MTPAVHAFHAASTGMAALDTEAGDACPQVSGLTHRRQSGWAARGHPHLQLELNPIGKKMNNEELVDVIEVQIKGPHIVRVMATGKTKVNAEAFINMAIARRGLKHHFYTTAPINQYTDGDELKKTAG